mgnify:FL=1
MDKKPEDLKYGITMEDIEDAFLKGTEAEIVEKATDLLDDTQNHFKRQSKTLDVCFNLEIVKIMLKKCKKGLTTSTG